MSNVFDRSHILTQLLKIAQDPGQMTDKAKDSVYAGTLALILDDLNEVKLKQLEHIDSLAALDTAVERLNGPDPTVGNTDNPADFFLPKGEG